jgi:hypothetical protein
VSTFKDKVEAGTFDLNIIEALKNSVPNEPGLCNPIEIHAAEY